MPDVRLHINSQGYGGWKSIRIQRGIEQIAGQFELGLTEKWSEQGVRWPINPGAQCRISIDGKTVITGAVDDTPGDYDADSHSRRIIGRDRTGDLVDCSAPSFQWAGRDLLAGAKALCEPFGIPVRSETDHGGAFDRLKSDEGETVFEVLETAARIRAVLLVSDGQGGLVIARAGAWRVPDKLVLGKNIKRGQFNNGYKERFSSIKVKGQQISADGWGVGDTGVSATVTDAGVKRHRPLVIIAEDDIDRAGAKKRATWQRNVSAGRSRQATYTVQGWRHAGHELWQPNQLIEVEDSYANLGGGMLITSVTFLLDDKNGFTTELNMMPPEAFDLIELPEPSGADAGVW